MHINRNELRAAATVADPRWAAVASRDARADGRFFYSVRTTGVYCRPCCASRPARPENVAFHASAAAAERAGFRPCKRCRPDRAAAMRMRRRSRSCAASSRPPSSRRPWRRWRAMPGISAYHLHRIFKQLTGVTPKAYAAAQRARRVREELAGSDTVTDAIYGAGYNSNGRFYEESDRLLGMTPTTFRAGGADTEIRFAVGDCSLGAILVAESDARRLRDPARRRSRCAGARPAGPLSAGHAGRRRRGVRAARRPGRRLRRGAPARSRPAARRARHRVPAARLAGAARDPGRRDRELRRDRRPHRRAAVGARGGAGLRRQRAGGRDPLPPRGATATARCRATAGASSASARCSSARPAHERARSPSPRGTAAAARGRGRRVPRRCRCGGPTGRRGRFGRRRRCDRCRRRHRWPAALGRTRRAGLRGHRAAARAGRLPQAGGALRPERKFPQPRRDGAARLRQRRIQILRLSAARADCDAARAPLRAPGADRQPLARGDGHRGALPGAPCRLHRPLPRRRADASRRRCCCGTAPATTTACIRTCTANTSSRCRSSCCCREPGRDFSGGEFVHDRAAAADAVAGRWWCRCSRATRR